MAFGFVRPDDFEWVTRPHEPGEPARHVAELSERAGLTRTRGYVWRYDPGAKERRQGEPVQEEVFVVLRGTLSIYLGDPPERVDVPAGDIVRVDPGTPLQSVNHGEDELLVYVYGTPPETPRSELLDSAV